MGVQVCLLDLDYNLPVQARDAALGLEDEALPESDVGREFALERMSNEGELGVAFNKARANNTILKLQRTAPYYKVTQTPNGSIPFTIIKVFLVSVAYTKLIHQTTVYSPSSDYPHNHRFPLIPPPKVTAAVGDIMKVLCEYSILQGAIPTHSA